MNEALRKIQCELNAPKDKYSDYGGYWYRSCEGILEALKPLLEKYEATLVITDDIRQVGDRFYVKATAIFTAGEDEVIVTAYAREPDHKTKSDDAQVTGAASSYARKYALNGLFLIDDNKDADTDEYKSAPQASNAEDDPKVEAKQIEQIQSVAEEAGITIDQICTTFRVGSLQDMTKKMWVRAIQMLEREIEKKGGAA